MPQSPKKNITKLSLVHGYEGTLKRIENAKEAFDENMVFPKPVEYEDIDRAILEFVRDNINNSINVKVELNDNMGYAPVSKLKLSPAKLRGLGWKPKYGLKEIFHRLVKYLNLKD